MFTQANISHANPVQYRANQCFVSWVATQPGLTWQVYVNKRLAKSFVSAGTNVGVWLSVPTSGVDRVDVGSVDPAEVHTDLSAQLPGAPQRRVTLNWKGGIFQGASIVGFRVYGESTPGGGINYASPLATIAAYPAGIVIDGYGNGGYSLFGYGNDGGAYSWTSGALANGTWNFAVKPYDASGNEGAAVLTSATILGPPSEPPRFPDGSRLHYAVNAYDDGIGYGLGGYGLSGGGLAQVTLSWNASTP